MTKSTPAAKIESATKAIQAILQLDVLERHKDELLSLMIWKITEAEGKYRLRYCTEGALRDPSAKKQHEHVYSRSWLIGQLKANPDRVQEVLQHAFGCVITVPEHQRLNRAPKDLIGWDRYRATGVRVFDRQANDWLL